jgi:hypothetical protein
MTVRRSPRPSTPPLGTNHAFKASTSGWYSQWKAKRNAETAPQTAPAATTPATTNEAERAESELVRWLTSDSSV